MKHARAAYAVAHQSMAQVPACCDARKHSDKALAGFLLVPEVGEAGFEVAVVVLQDGEGGAAEGGGGLAEFSCGEAGHG